MMDLKTQRNSLRLSQSRLARLSGVSRYRICLHELGDLALDAGELAQIDAAIQAEINRLQDVLVRSHGMARQP
jgi:predicted transcriptional regulator